MNNRLNPIVGLVLSAMILALIVLGGCRAFEPEAVIVNRAPETFIIGAPIEHGGGYYHFHVYWYGKDSDGFVERFVWALTDTTKQNEDTVEDEEDENFNPALDSSHLEIGHWTTKTDSIFNFTIDQGTAPNTHMTLHMVAVDDFGDYDRTPARLHFFSNTLGNPEIHFFGMSQDDTVPTEIVYGVADTCGFGKSYLLYWVGSTPNIINYDLEARREIDEVGDPTDGLLGYKWKVLGASCNASVEDCWHPRKFNESTGDSFSFFGKVDTLIFKNSQSVAAGENPYDDPFDKKLPDGPVDLQVNSIDLAGVEVAEYMRNFTFMVNYDPETILLNREVDWAYPADPDTYPYYILLNDEGQEHHPFSRGERVPDRSYVVFKALGRDSKYDVRQDENFKLGFTGYVEGAIHNYGGGVFRFQTSASDLNTQPTWPRDGIETLHADGWYADTLGFLVAPRTEFRMNMQAVDEHGRRDGTPDTLTFNAGFEPCVQCVEVLPGDATSAYDETVACYDPAAGSHPCFGATPDLYLTTKTIPTAGRTYLPRDLGISFMAVDKVTDFVSIVVDTAGLSANNYLIQTYQFNMDILLHGQDFAAERWTEAGQEQWRTMGWKYQVDYDCDPSNSIRDGGGRDDIKDPTWEIDLQNGLLSIDDNGVWKVRVKVSAPKQLVDLGRDSYIYGDLLRLFNYDMTRMDEIEHLFDVTTKQFGLGRVQAIAIDQTLCNTQPVRPAYYHTFKGLRPPAAVPPVGRTWRHCDLTSVVPGAVLSSISMSQMAMGSLDDTPVSNMFHLVIETPTGDFECTGDGF